MFSFYVLKKIFMYLLDIQRHQKTFITSPFDYLTQPGKRACMRKDVHAYIPENVSLSEIQC